MSFIGIISNNKSFENIKRKIEKEMKIENVKLINLTEQNIENMKNVKFETLIIDSNLENFKSRKKIIEMICDKTKYIILNADIKLEMEMDICKKINIITYGLNQKSTITISSISDMQVLIYIQRNIININKKILQVEEKSIKLDLEKKLGLYEILIIYAILSIYSDKIIEQI